MRVLERLQQHAEAQPDVVAFSVVGHSGAPPQRLTYQQLAAVVSFVAQQLRAATPDDAVIILQLPNGLVYPVAYLAVLAAARTAFPLHPLLIEREVADAADKTGAAWLISDRKPIEGLTSITPKQLDAWIDQLAGDAPSSNLIGCVGGQMLLQSSGTTGMPKLVERSAESIDAVAQSVADSVGLVKGDQIIAAIPMCHSYGIENAVVGPLWAGSSVQVCDGFDPDRVAQVWAEHERCVFPAVPVMIDLLSSREDLPEPKNMKAVYAAGATMPEAVEQAFAHRFGQRVGQLYGATEIGSVTFDHPFDDALPEGCVGRPMAGVRIRILDLEHPADHPPLGPGQEGQVAVQAPSMLSRYLGDEPVPLVDGHFLTGDLGTLDENGALTITGRVKTLIEVGGMKVNPMEVEGVLARHPGIAECVVVANFVSQTLSRMTAFFVPTDAEDPPSVAELRGFAKDHLAPYKVPRVFKAIEAMPRSSLGKVQRALLAEAGV